MHTYSNYHSLLVDLVPLSGVEDEEVVLTVRGEDLKSTVSQ